MPKQQPRTRKQAKAAEKPARTRDNIDRSSEAVVERAPERRRTPPPGALPDRRVIDSRRRS